MVVMFIVSIESEDDSTSMLQSSHSVPNSPNPVTLFRTKLHSISETTEKLTNRTFSYDGDSKDDGIDEGHDTTGGSDCSGDVSAEDSGYGHLLLPIHRPPYKQLVVMSPEDKFPPMRGSYQMLNIQRLDAPHEYALINMGVDRLPESSTDSDSNHEC